MQNEFLSLERTKQRPNGSSNLVGTDQRRVSGWHSWGSGSGGLRGGMMAGRGIEDASYMEVEVREKEQPPRNVEMAYLGDQPRRQEQDSSHSGMQFDSNIDDELACDYGSEGTDLDNLLDVELNRAEQNDSGVNKELSTW